MDYDFLPAGNVVVCAEAGARHLCVDSVVLWLCAQALEAVRKMAVGSGEEKLNATFDVL